MTKLTILLILFMVKSLTINPQELEHIDFISPFNDGLSAVKKDNAWAFINTEGEMAIDYRDDLVLTVFDDVSYPIFNSGLCLITKMEEGISYFGYIDKKGENVIKPQYLNATNFDNGLAIVLELHKNVLGINDILGKIMIDYSYTESAINPKGEIVYYLSEGPQHITLSKDYVPRPPRIKTKFISEGLIAILNDDSSWSIKKV